MKKYKFEIYVPPEVSAGIRGFSDIITIEVESGDPGGVPGEFEKFMEDAFLEWFDGARIEEIGGK